MAKNFSYSLVATAPSPATTGTSLVVTGGDGTLFPPAPFQATIWPTASQPTAANAEIVTVTGVSTDTLTIVRTQEGSSARTVIIGDQIAATVTAGVLVQSNRYNPVTAALQNITLDGSTDFNTPDVLEVGASYFLEVPATSTLEVMAYAPNAPIPKFANVDTLETTTSASFADLATVGPSVTVAIGKSGMALLCLSTACSSNTSADYAVMGFTASGANTIVATHTDSAFIQAGSTSNEVSASMTKLLINLTPGNTTFTCKYEIITGGIATFRFRKISVIPL